MIVTKMSLLRVAASAFAVALVPLASGIELISTEMFVGSSNCSAGESPTVMIPSLFMANVCTELFGGVIFNCSINAISIYSDSNCQDFQVDQPFEMCQNPFGPPGNNASSNIICEELEDDQVVTFTSGAECTSDVLVNQTSEYLVAIDRCQFMTNGENGPTVIINVNHETDDVTAKVYNNLFCEGEPVKEINSRIGECKNGSSFTNYGAFKIEYMSSPGPDSTKRPSVSSTGIPTAPSSAGISLLHPLVGLFSSVIMMYVNY